MVPTRIFHETTLITSLVIFRRIALFNFRGRRPVKFLKERHQTSEIGICKPRNLSFATIIPDYTIIDSEMLLASMCQLVGTLRPDGHLHGPSSQVAHTLVITNIGGQGHTEEIPTILLKNFKDCITNCNLFVVILLIWQKFFGSRFVLNDRKFPECNAGRWRSQFRDCLCSRHFLGHVDFDFDSHSVAFH